MWFRKRRNPNSMKSRMDTHEARLARHSTCIILLGAGWTCVDYRWYPPKKSGLVIPLGIEGVDAAWEVHMTNLRHGGKR